MLNNLKSAKVKDGYFIRHIEIGKISHVRRGLPNTCIRICTCLLGYVIFVY